MNAPTETPRVSKPDLESALAALGLGRGDVVAFHTSLSAFGRIRGGADALIDAVLETVGREGAALAPTFTFDARWGPGCPPVFDLRQSLSVTGRTPEVFRLRPNALRSLHPTHSWAAIGARAVDITRGHEDSPTPCGPISPLGRLVALSGKVLLLGVTLESCTFFHYCEEVAVVPYHLQPRPTRVVMTTAAGATVERDFYLHRWGGSPRDFTKPEPELLRLGLMRKTTLGPAEIRLLDASKTAEFLIDILRHNPDYFLV